MLATVTFNESGFTEDSLPTTPRAHINTPRPAVPLSVAIQQCRYVDNEGVTGQGVRRGKNSDSMIEMLENYPGWIRRCYPYTRMECHGRRMHLRTSNILPTPAMEMAGTGNVTLHHRLCAAQNFTVNVGRRSPPAVRQTSGARFLIDDIEVASTACFVLTLPPTTTAGMPTALTACSRLSRQATSTSRSMPSTAPKSPTNPSPPVPVSIDPPAGLYRSRDNLPAAWW